MKRASGFTLVELLVVIAIISILAAIVTPQVSKFILRANVGRATEEIHSIEIALTSMLSDAGVRDFRHMFPSGYSGFAAASTTYSFAQDFYELLRMGREAPIADDMREEVRQRLGTSYLADIGKDPWGNLYQVYPGPWRRTNGAILFRSYRAGDGSIEEGTWTDYTYDTAAKADADAEVPGNPEADDLEGYPAPRDFTFYIWSYGPNSLNDQLFNSGSEEGYAGGGDDINNWDSEQGWMAFVD